MTERGNLLVIANKFPDQEDIYIGGIFIKNQMKYLSKYFKKIFVIIPSPISISTFEKMPSKNYIFENIYVYFIKYIDMPLFYFIRRDLWAKIELYYVINFIKNHEIQFNLVHAHNTWRAGCIGVGIKKIFNVPVVITEHTSKILHDAIEKEDSLFIKTWKGCDGIIRVNNKDMELFKNIGISEKKIFSIPNGFDHKLFYYMDKCLVRAKLKLPIEKIILLSVGALLPAKGYMYMLETMKQIVKKRSDILYIIIGDGKFKKELEAKINKMGLTNYVVLLGSKPHPEISLWMNSCDLFVLPSLRESFGIVQIEAMACGKPVVATKNGGSEEIILNDKLGFLVEPADPEDLVEKIFLALDRKWNRENILVYAKQYEWEIISRNILGVYEQVLH